MEARDVIDQMQRAIIQAMRFVEDKDPSRIKSVEDLLRVLDEAYDAASDYLKEH